MSSAAGDGKYSPLALGGENRMHALAKPAPRDILVIKPSSLGDVVHTLPAVSLVKRRWPQARVRWLVNPEWAPLLEGNPDIEETVLFPRSDFRGLSGLSKIPAWAKRMRRDYRADLVLDFQGLLRSALIARLCNRGEIVGLSDAREGAGLLYHFAADVNGIAHAVDRYLALVKSLGIEVSHPLRWNLPEGERPGGFAMEEPFILIHPFSRGAGKSLSVSDTVELCKALAPQPVVLAGRASENVPQTERVTNLLNSTTLSELIWLIKKAAFVISVDSGPMHIAAAITSKLISIHTWSDPAKVGPYAPDAWVWKDGAIFQMKHIGDPEKHQSALTIADIGRFAANALRAGT